jgi:dihydrofolate reductase
MGKVVVDLSMSLDGFITGPNDSIELPLGEGGERLHDWIFGGNVDRAGSSPRTSAIDRNREVIDEAFETTGAMVMGRRLFDIGEKPWGDEPPFQVPVFVLTHHPRETIKKGKTTFTFITDGIKSALEKAQAAAGDKDVSVSAANVAQQYLKAGLVDEIQIHLIPILLGEGVRLFKHLGTEPIELERMTVIESPDVTHLRFRVIK